MPESLSLGLGRPSLLLIICAVGFPLMFLMLPLALLGKGAAGIALLWGAPPAQSGGENGNRMLECSCMMWKAESPKWRGEKRCTMHSRVFLVTFFFTL